MKILQISTIDLLGSRFNGRDLNRTFRNWGHAAEQCVWIKQGDDKDTWKLAGSIDRGLFFSVRQKINNIFARLESLFSIQSLLYPWGIKLYYDRRFKKADIVHYHLLHNGYFSLLSLPKLMRNKPSVWTIHDPWAMTGHCVYPQTCQEWLEGCKRCSEVKRFISMRFDNAALMFRIKKWIYEKLDVDLVFASQFMLKMAKASPLFKGMRMHYIPFGVDLNIFDQKDKSLSRNRFKIPIDHFVISFRSTTYEYKGLEYIQAALKKLAEDKQTKNVTILTVNTKGLLNSLEGDFSIVDLGSVTDENIISDFYNAADVFLMPSTGEAFGLMAIEAMACAVPVVVFEGTSLPEVVFAPRGGVSVPMKDADALYSAVKRLKDDPEERETIGKEAYRLSRLHYDFEEHAKKVMNLYEDVIARRGSRA